MGTKGSEWIAVYARATPSPEAWLRDVDPAAAEQLMTIIRVVMSWDPPPRYPASGIWKLMRNDEGTDMSGFCEARDKQGGWLYRLICRFDGKAPERGLSKKALVICHGFRKSVDSPTPTRELITAIENWNSYVGPPLRASGPIVFPVVFEPLR